MYFQAIATQGTKRVKENLDNFVEVQEFCNKVERRGFLNITVTSFNESGANKTIDYVYSGQNWDKIN